jgi:hypothetical protein
MADQSAWLRIWEGKFLERKIIFGEGVVKKLFFKKNLKFLR